MSSNVPAYQIESPGLNRDSAARRSGDGSFDSQLQEAQKILAEKKKISLFAPWAEVEKIFNILPLEFEFNFSTSKIDDDPKKENYETGKSRPDQIRSSKENNPQETYGITTGIKIQKDILAKNLPNPQLPPLIPLIGIYNASSLKPVTSHDLKILIDEIVEKVELLKVNRRAELNLLMSSKDLGDLALSLTLKNGLVSVQIAAALPETKRSLEENLSELESALKNAKIDLEGLKIVEVKDGNRSDRPG